MKVKSRRRIPDKELHFVENQIALLLDVVELLKLAGFHCNNLEVLGHLTAMKAPLIKLRSNMFAWRDALRAAAIANQDESTIEIDYDDLDSLVRDANNRIEEIFKEIAQVQHQIADVKRRHHG